MNGLVFPSMLIATIMVAGAFMLMPVDEAATVHDTITGDVGTLVVNSAEGQVVGDAGANIVILGDSAAVKVGTVCVAHNDAAGNDLLFVEVDLDPTDDAAEAVVLTNGEIEGQNLCAAFAGFNVKMDQAGTDAGDTIDFSINWRTQTP